MRFQFMAFILLFLLWAPEPSQAQLSRETKRQWLAQLQNCRDRCSELSRALLADYARAYKTAIISISPQAESTLLYMHSFTSYPQEDDDYLKYEMQKGRSHIFAPVLTAHHESSTPGDYLKVRSSDWLLDAELGLFLAARLGPKVILKGFSLGGLLALHLIKTYPKMISRAVLITPALMIRNHINESACVARKKWIQEIGKFFNPRISPREVEKFMNGACILAATMRKVLSPIPLHPQDVYGYPVMNDMYLARLYQIKDFARSLKVPIFYIYSEADDVIDTLALRSFSKGLAGNDRSIIYPFRLQIRHVATPLRAYEKMYRFLHSL